MTPGTKGKRHPWGRLPLLPLATILLGMGLGTAAGAQQVPPKERLYNQPQVEIQKALEQMQAYETQRLPALAGFVNASAASLDRLQNPRYQFHIDILFQGPSQTVVRVSAKITAWFEDTGPSASHYEVVPSNGRLEEDLLDRLSVYIEKGASRQPVAGIAPPPPPAASPNPGPAGTSGAPAAAASPGAATTPPLSAVPTGNAPEALASRIAAIRTERETLEQKERALQQQVSELQSASRNEVFLKNVAVVRSPQTPIYEQDQETSKILLHADPDDEFPIHEVRGGWVRVGMEKGAEGWLRGSQLRQPGDPSDADTAALNFNASQEEIKPFHGEWSQLKGKNALYVFAQPARELPASALGQNQLRYAEFTFVEGYREATHSEQEVDGVVVVFLGQKGGVAAATLADIRRWHEGTLTDKLFLERCSLDPSESFRDAVSR